MRPSADTDDAAHYAKLDEIAAAATGHALAGQFVTAANSIGCVSSEQMQSCTKEGELR